MYCPTCGAEQPLKPSYCNRCGANLIESTGQHNPAVEAFKN
jgi:predicted amidophosphoribosyltransferase